MVWNALKTSIKVLGSDMPQLEEAQVYLTRAKEVLDAGVESLERLSTRDGEKVDNVILGYVKDSIAKCA